MSSVTVHGDCPMMLIARFPCLLTAKMKCSKHRSMYRISNNYNATQPNYLVLL